MLCRSTWAHTETLFKFVDRQIGNLWTNTGVACVISRHILLLKQHCWILKWSYALATFFNKQFSGFFFRFLLWFYSSLEQLIQRNVKKWKSFKKVCISFIINMLILKSWRCPNGKGYVELPQNMLGIFTNISDK